MTLRCWNGPTCRDLSPLPETAEEVRRVGGALGADPSRDFFLGEDAAEAVVKAAKLDDRRVLLFATHGLVPGDLDALAEPALALTPSAGGPEDGLLTMREILGLRLSADVAVLSACNTAAADSLVDEAFSGLGRAFFHAGPARSC